MFAGVSRKRRCSPSGRAATAASGRGGWAGSPRTAMSPSIRRPVARELHARRREDRVDASPVERAHRHVGRSPGQPGRTRYASASGDQTTELAASTGSKVRRVETPEATSRLQRSRLPVSRLQISTADAPPVARELDRAVSLRRPPAGRSPGRSGRATRGGRRRAPARATSSRPSAETAKLARPGRAEPADAPARRRRPRSPAGALGVERRATSVPRRTQRMWPVPAYTAWESQAAKQSGSPPPIEATQTRRSPTRPPKAPFRNR